MVSIVPLSIWAATGRLDRAWQALREFLMVMGILVGIPLVFVGLSLLPLLWS
jgi:hypothetical protein